MSRQHECIQTASTDIDRNICTHAAVVLIFNYHVDAALCKIFTKDCFMYFMFVLFFFFFK